MIASVWFGPVLLGNWVQQNTTMQSASQEHPRTSRSTHRLIDSVVRLGISQDSCSPYETLVARSVEAMIRGDIDDSIALHQQVLVLVSDATAQ